MVRPATVQYGPDHKRGAIKRQFQKDALNKDWLGGTQDWLGGALPKFN